MQKINKTVTYLWWALKITYGLLFILVGTDKFFNILTHWDRFVCAGMTDSMPISIALFLKIFGFLQIIIGFTILSSYTVIGAMLALIVLIGIFINLLFTQDFMVVLTHDFTMILGLILLIELTAVKKSGINR